MNTTVLTRFKMLAILLNRTFLDKYNNLIYLMSDVMYKCIARHNILNVTVVSL